MFFWSTTLVPALLLVGAAGLMVWHVQSWLSARRQPFDGREREFRRRQFRRRMQTSAAMGLLAAVLWSGVWLVPRLHSRVFAVLFCIGVLCAVLWIGLMAVTDMMATKFHFSRQHQDYLVEQAKLRAELRRIKERGEAEGGGRKEEGGNNGQERG